MQAFEHTRAVNGVILKMVPNLNHLRALKPIIWPSINNDSCRMTLIKSCRLTFSDMTLITYLSFGSNGQDCKRPYKKSHLESTSIFID